MSKANNKKGIYLSNTAMKATSHSLGLISQVIGFEITELWACVQGQDLRCVYVHATDLMLVKYPHIVAGHHPKRDIKEHTISPALCKLVSKDSYGSGVKGSNCHWKSIKDLPGVKELYPGHPLSVKTEMAYRLEGDTGDLNVFIVGLSPRQIEFKEATVKFMEGLAYAVYIAAFNVEEEIEQEEGEADDEILDDKKFAPEHVPVNADHGNVSPRGSDMGEGSHPGSRPHSGSNTTQNNNLGVFQQTVAMAIDDVSGEHKRNDNHHVGPGMHEKKISYHDHDHDEEEEHDHFDASAGGPSEQYFDPNRLLKKDPNAIRHTAPTWEPASDYCYPVADIPVKYHVPDNLTFDNFSDVQHLADGSNSNVFLCRFNGSRVVVKIIKEEVQHNPIAVHEFDQEYGMLARMDNPHIIRVLGAGQIPRRFIVLEHLGGGSLNDILAENQNQQGITNMLFRKPSFTYDNLLLKARDMAEAFDYLHFRCHSGATIIHRDLKPDNVGFTSDGTLKLFDFGLVTCVKTRTNAKDAYDMTGYTGSLRYMAPEVALREPYTEKVDVYSFGIMLWQMAKDRLPFKGLGRQEFFRDIVQGGGRPKIDKTWPAGFNDLLCRCWRRDPEERPSFAMIIIDLNKLISSIGAKKHGPRRGKPILKKANTVGAVGAGANAQSSWF